MPQGIEAPKPYDELMPENLMSQIIRRSGIDEPGNVSIHGVRHKGFLKNLNSNHFTEIISLPDIELVKSGRVKISMSDMLGGGALYYKPQEFAAHLEYILALLDSCENYHVHLIDKPTDDLYMVYAREELGVIVAKTSQPPVVLAISEGNMTGAFWDFLKNLVEEKAYLASRKASSASELRDYLIKLKD